MQQNKLTLTNILLGAGGVVTFIFSFLKFYKVGDFGSNAWDTDATGFASAVPAILGLVAAVWVGLDLFGVKLPDKVLTFSPTQLTATWGISAFGIMLSWFTAVDDKGPGFWLMFLGSLAMGAGAVLGLLGLGGDPISAADIDAVRAKLGGSDDKTPPPPPAQ